MDDGGADPDDGSDHDSNGDHAADVQLSTGPDEIFDSDEMLDALAGLSEADLLANAKPIEIDDRDRRARREAAPGDDAEATGAEDGADGEVTKRTGVGAVLERLQAADAAAGVRASRAAQGQQEAARRDPGRHGARHRGAGRDVRSRARRRRASAWASCWSRTAIISELDLTKALAAKFGIEFSTSPRTQVDMPAASLISEKLCRRYGAIPVQLRRRQHAAGRHGRSRPTCSSPTTCAS